MLLSERVAQIRAADSRLEKTRLFREHVNASMSFAKMVKLAMDPSIVFNLGKRSVTAKGVGTEPLAPVDLEILERLSRRELNRTQGAEWANARAKMLTAEEAELLVCILDKDLSWGLGTSSINSAIPGFLTEFHCMLASPFEAKKCKFPAAIEPKYDGMRVLAFVDLQDGVSEPTVDFFTRTGKPVDSLSDALKAELVSLAKAWWAGTRIRSLVFDGEVMGDDFKETMERARRKSEVFESARYFVFDALSRDAYNALSNGEVTMGYKARRACLSEAFEPFDFKFVQLPESYLVSSVAEAQIYYNSFRDLGYEGAILKALDGIYRPKRHVEWMKLKAEETEDLEIVGYEPGEGKFAHTLGAIIVNRNGVQVRVGTGLTDDDRAMFWLNQAMYIGKLIEVQYQEVTPDGSLRHPRFVRVRMDKSEW